MRAVFDTNIYISAFVFPNSSAEKALLRCIEGNHQLLISKPIIEETLGILARKFSRDRENLAKTAIFLDEISETITAEKTINIIDDEPDNRILECAVAGQADAIITGDKAMLKLSSFDEIAIISLRSYLAKH